MLQFYARLFIVCSAHLCVALFSLLLLVDANQPQTCSVATTNCFTSLHNASSVRVYLIQKPAAAGRVCADDSRDLLNLPLRVTQRGTIVWAPHERCRYHPTHSVCARKVSFSCRNLAQPQMAAEVYNATVASEGVLLLPSGYCFMPLEQQQHAAMRPQVFTIKPVSSKLLHLLIDESSHRSHL